MKRYRRSTNIRKICSPLWTTIEMQIKTTVRYHLTAVRKVNVKVAQSCLTLCDPMNCTVQGILQTRILEWVAFSFSRGFSQPRDRIQVSCIAGASLQLSHKGSPRILDWIAYHSSSGSSQPSNRTRGFCIAGGFFNNWVLTWVRMLTIKKKSIKRECGENRMRLHYWWECKLI